MPAIRVPSSYPGTSCDDGWDELRYKHADAEGFPARSYVPQDNGAAARKADALMTLNSEALEGKASVNTTEPRNQPWATRPTRALRDETREVLLGEPKAMSQAGTEIAGLAPGQPHPTPCAPFDLAGNLEQLLASMNRVKAGAK